MMLTLALVCGWAGDLAAVVVCPDGQKPVEATLILNPTADDLFQLVRWNREAMEEEVVAPGGSGTLSEVLTEWVVDDSSSGVNTLDIPSLTFSQADTNAVFISDLGFGRYIIEYCLPNDVNAVTIHAIFRGEVELRGIESTVGHIVERDGKFTIEAVANRYTATWFKKFREGKMRSGAEVLINIMDSYYGSEAPRSLTSLQVVALNEMYSSIPDAGLLRGNGFGADIEGTVIYIESSPASVCFSPSVTEFYVVDILKLDENNCATGLENNFWNATTTNTNGYWQHGVIIDARALVEQGLTDAVKMSVCNGGNATITINYDLLPWNYKTILSQGDGALVWEIEGNDQAQEVPCEPTDVLLQVFGNTGQPIYEVRDTLDPPIV